MREGGRNRGILRYIKLLVQMLDNNIIKAHLCISLRLLVGKVGLGIVRSVVHRSDPCGSHHCPNRKTVHRKPFQFDYPPYRRSLVHRQIQWQSRGRDFCR